MIDETDIKILEELSKNSRITMKQLGEKVCLTGQAVAVRVAKLEDTGVIEKYTVKINYEKTGKRVHALIEILLTKLANHFKYINFVNSQKDYVIHNYKISGSGCYTMECIFPSNTELNEFLLKLNEYANYKLTLIIDDTLKQDCK